MEIVAFLNVLIRSLLSWRKRHCGIIFPTTKSIAQGLYRWPCSYQESNSLTHLAIVPSINALTSSPIEFDYYLFRLNQFLFKKQFKLSHICRNYRKCERLEVNYGFVACFTAPPFPYLRSQDAVEKTKPSLARE